MTRSTFWTEPHLTGITLIVGCLLAGWGFALSSRDEQGTFIYNLPPRAQLVLISKHSTRWKWSASLVISGVVLTLLGLALLTSLLRDAGDRLFSLPVLVAFGFGAVL